MGSESVLSDALDAITEGDFLATVREMAELYGWTVFHTWNSRHSPAGEPDLRMVHPGWKRMIWAELKTETGELTQKQVDILLILASAQQEYYLWRPRHMDWIEQVLSRRRKWGKL